jgi:cell division protein FtsI/penicillin-binding protein 2
MTLRVEHEMHRRRFSRNLGLGLVLGAFVVLVFALTVVKVTQGDRMHANDAKKNTGVVIQQTGGGSQP